MLGPIFVREWLTIPRGTQHYLLRVSYFGLLWVLGLATWQALVGWHRTATLGDAAHFGFALFRLLTVYVQLPLIIFFAALSAASTIAREKDRRTFVLLLITDLRDYEIVLGKVLGSLLQIGVLLAGMVPILAVLLLLGGITPLQVAEAFLVLSMTALAAGSLGGMVALWRDQTFQSLALTVLFLVLYLCVVLGLAGLPTVAPHLFATEDEAGRINVTQLQEWLSPFHALLGVLEPPPPEEDAGLSPALGFAAAMLLLSFLVNLWSLLRLRVWNPSGEPVIQREAPPDAAEEEKDRLKAHAAPGAVRTVWENPILWRETRTLAYGRRPLLVKVAYFLVLGLICYYVLAPLFGDMSLPRFFAAYGLVPVTVLSVLLISAQAVTSITSERDGGALDLLLVTDISPKEFIFGKVLGILWNTKEFLLPPLILVCVYAGFGMLATPPRGHPELAFGKNVESLATLLAGALIVMAFAVVFGIHVALRTTQSQFAIVKSLGTVFFLSVGTLICIYLLQINTARFEYQWITFIFFLPGAIYGLGTILNGDRPSGALWVAAWCCPPAVFYSVLNVIIARPGSEESADPLIPFLVVGSAFVFTVTAMLVPLLAEFDVATGRTTGGTEE